MFINSFALNMIEKMSVNDDMFVSASNSFENFVVIMHPFKNIPDNKPTRCSMTDQEQFIFIFAAERISRKIPYICICLIIKSTCISQIECTDILNENNHQEYFLINIDINGIFTYGFSNSFIFKLDIYKNKILLTRNSGKSLEAVHQCIPCSNNSSRSFCPLASLSDIDLSRISTYSQATAYPETSDVADIEDILNIKNMFQISSEPHYLVISPLLWTFIAIGLCILIFII